VTTLLSTLDAVPIALAVGMALGVAVALIGFMLFRPKRRCPACHLGLVVLRETRDGLPLYGYEVYACPRCTNAFTAVVGNRQRFGFCPECHQRTLETPCMRLAEGPEGQRRVEVHEGCHLCGHHASREVSDLPYLAPPKRGQIVPFRPRHHDSDGP
jgi:hypothetical protein